MPERGAEVSPERSSSLCLESRLILPKSVSIVLRSLLDYVESAGKSPSFMRTVVVGSDRWYVREQRRVQEACGSATKLLHVYGVSETTFDSTYFIASAVELEEHGLTPIGRPFPNAQAYILDAHLQPVPVGVRVNCALAGQVSQRDIWIGLS